MAAYEVLLLNTAIPQIQAAQSGDTYLCPRDIAFSAALTLTAGTANGVPYLNGSKVVTTGSALTFDGTRFGVNGGLVSDNNLVAQINSPTSSAKFMGFNRNGDYGLLVGYDLSNDYASIRTVFDYPIVFSVFNAEKMRLTSTGLGIGTNNPGAKLDVDGTVRAQIAGGGTGRYLDIGSDGSGTTRFFNNYAGGGDFGFVWKIGASDRMTLDASGNLLVGATSNAAITGFSGSATGQAIQGGLPVLALVDSDDTTNYVSWLANSGGTTYLYSKHSSSPLIFGAANTERARITSGGYFKASNNGAYTGISSSYHEFYQTADSVALLVRATNGSYTSSVLEINGDRATTNATYNLISAYNGPISGQFIVRDSGNAVNTTGTYGTISDQKLKQDIVDAGSQWADIKAVRFRKFKMKNDSTGLLQLGVVAQELEQTSPGLVEEHTDRDREGNDLGTTTKSVKTSVLLMKAAVALQEAMARIEKLEAEVAALKGA